MKNLSLQSKNLLLFLFLLVTLSPLTYYIASRNVVFYTIVDGHSMEPSLRDGNTILVEKYPLIHRHLQVGDVILFHEYNTIGRGDGKIDIKRVAEIMSPKSYFVVGDNTKISWDSRFYGPIHESQIIGVVIK